MEAIFAFLFIYSCLVFSIGLLLSLSPSPREIGRRFRGGVLAAGVLSLLALWHFTDNHEARALTSGFDSAAKALTEHQGNADASQTTGDALTKQYFEDALDN
jgi:hypothetical protein